jgi:hypothetical protein
LLSGPPHTTTHLAQDVRVFETPPRRPSLLRCILESDTEPDERVVSHSVARCQHSARVCFAPRERANRVTEIDECVDKRADCSCHAVAATTTAVTTTSAASSTATSVAAKANVVGAVDDTEHPKDLRDVHTALAHEQVCWRTPAAVEGLFVIQVTTASDG